MSSERSTVHDRRGEASADDREAATRRGLRRNRGRDRALSERAGRRPSAALRLPVFNSAVEVFAEDAAPPARQSDEGNLPGTEIAIDAIEGTAQFLRNGMQIEESAASSDAD
jgi:hypothetical protein